MNPFLRFTFYVRLLFAFTPLLLCLPSARGATEIRAFVTITNTPAGLTSNLVINIGTATTRYWTNSAAGAPSTSIQTTNSTAASATNLLAHLAAYPVYSLTAGSPQLGVGFVSSNTSTLVFTAPLNTNLTVTFGGNWARVIYDTNTFADASPILSVTNTMSPRLRTNSMNSIVNLLASGIVPSNSFPPANYAFRHYTDNTSAQTLSNKTLSAAVLQGGRMTGATNLTGTNVALTNAVFYLVNASGVTVWSGYATAVTNGAFWSNLFYYSTLTNPISYSLVNRSNAVRSEGIGGNSLQIGSNAAATASLSVALGNSSTASGSSALAIGTGATATNSDAIAIGTGSISTNSASISIGSSSLTTGAGGVAVGFDTLAGLNAVAIGNESSASASSSLAIVGTATAANAVALGVASVSGENSSALGYLAAATHSNSTAIGKSSATTQTNEIVLGSSSDVVHVPGRIEGATSTNATWKGTNIINAQVVFTPTANTGLANGYNAAVAVNAAHVRFSGPSAAYTNVGFSAANKMDGKMHFCTFDNPGLSMTFLHDSGIDPGNSTNRIYTGTGALINSTNRVVHVIMSYDDAVTAWRIWSFR
jgi:hypothetical protein